MEAWGEGELITYTNLSYQLHVTWQHKSYDNYTLNSLQCISYLIGRKCTVNFQSQRLWRHFCKLYSNHVKVTGNHVKFAHFVLHALSVKKQKHGFHFFHSTYIIKQFLLLDSSLVRVVSLSLELPLITPTSTWIILDIKKTSSNNCF